MERDYQDIYNKIKEINKYEVVGDTNILYLINKSYDENSYNAILCRLLKVPSYRKKFFAQLFSLKLSDFECDTKNKFQTEVTTTENRRMDIYLETDNSIVCIENKIFAEDQENQLKDYWKEIKKRAGKKKKAYIIYLSLDGYPPSEFSIEPKEWKKLSNENIAYTLSYHDIEKWLKNCEQLQRGIDKEVLFLLKQYHQNVEYLLQQEKNSEILKKMVLKYFKNKEINSEQEWTTFYEICRPKDNELRKQLYNIYRLIGEETANKLIKNTTLPNRFYHNISDGFVYYTKSYDIQNSEDIPMRLQLIYRYNKYTSPFKPYIGLYHIHDKYRQALEDIFTSILEKAKYEINFSRNHIYSYVKYNSNHKNILEKLDKEITKFFS
ncbi:MAG: PD-(D/E)XK nuclease family protein [Brevinema sp.]